MRFKQIVIGVDFSPNSRQALHEALRLKHDEHTGLVAVHIIERIVVDELVKHAEMTEDAVRTQSENCLRRWLDEVAGPGHAVLGEAVVASPFEGLIHAVERHQADLLILGSRGRETDIGHPGAVASKCIRKAAVDVMLVRRKQDGPFKKIVACTDNSATSERVVACALAVAERDASVCEALHVHAPVSFGDLALDPFPPGDALRFEQSRDSVARAGFDAFMARCTPGASPVFQVSTNVTDGITGYLKESGADLAVLGTRGRTGLRAFLLGTTAERLVHEAPCSILVIKEHKA
mgnify:CR=1 FL=1